MNNKFNYIDFNGVYSRNCMLNFIIGERGVGKTLGMTIKVIKRFLDHDKQFMYVRRYKNDLKKSVPNFFDQIKELEMFPEHTFAVKGDLFYIDGKLAGYAVALSTSGDLKSTAFPKIETIIYDEFIIDKGNKRYIPNEPEKLLSLIDTVIRLREGVKVILLGNAISITNPYFTYFDLTLPYGSEYKIFKNGTICVQYSKNEAFREARKKSTFGKLVEGTSYGDYSISNTFLRDSNAFIKKKGKGCHYYFTMYVNNQVFGAWINWNTSEIFISKDVDPNCPFNFALTNNDHNDSTVLAKLRSNSWYKNVVTSYRNGTLMFESQKIKGQVINIINRTLTY